MQQEENPRRQKEKIKKQEAKQEEKEKVSLLLGKLSQALPFQGVDTRSSQSQSDRPTEVKKRGNENARR